MSNSNIYVMEDDETSGSEEISDSEIDSFLLDKDLVENALAVPPQEFLFAPQAMSESVILPDLACLDQETQDRLQALLQAAGITKVANENRSYGDPEILKRLSSSVSSALDEAAAALTRMKNDDKSVEDPSGAVVTEIAGAEEGESLLSLACSAGYYELAQVLLAMRTNVEDRGSKGDCTPLMEAASAGHADIVKLLIAHGADMTAQSSTGNTPLMYACASGHEEVVRVLLKAGADVSLHNENGHTPLMEAASAGHVGIAKLLVEHGAQVNAHSTEFKVGLESPLTLACYKGHLEMVRYLLQVGGDNQSPGRQEELHTALMEASMDGHVEVARLLLDAGAQVNLPTDSFESPLTLAACGGHTELATLLLERGANLEEPNDEGYTPLMEAAREGHEETVTVLLDWGAFVNAQTEETGETALTLACCGGFQEVSVLLLNHDGDIELGANTPLMEAAQEGHVDLVRYLMKRGANVNASTASGDTPLTYAAENGHTDVCTAILDGGALLEQVAEGGRTALMKAGRAGHLCTVQYLLSKGADPNKTTSSNDHCALSLACGGGHLTVVDLLLQHGADPSVKLKDGATCIMEAAKGGHTAVVQLLIDWPGQQMSLAAAGGLQLPIDQNSAHNIVPPPPPNLSLPSCAEAGNAALMSNHSMSSLANVLPQFLLPTTVSSSVGANYGNLSFGYATGLNVNVGLGVGQNQQQSLASETSFLAYKDPLTQAEKALLKQASEKLSAAELQQLQELLKAQFQETAAQLANRVQSTNAGNNNSTSVAAASASTTRTSVGASSLPANHSASNSSSAKSKKAELEAAMKELEQLKKTQQLYEQLQRALEQKDEKTIANKQSSKSKVKSVQQQQPLPAVNSSSRKDSSCFALPVVPPPSPPPPPPPPPLQQQFFSQSTPVLPQSNVSQQQQMVSFQLPALDPAQLQYLQQQFSLALSAQNFQFQLQQQNSGNPSTCSLPTTPSLLFPSLPPNNGNTVSVVSNADGTSALAQIQLPATNDSSPSLLPLPPGHNNAVQQQSHSSANIYVPLPLQLPVAAASADVSAQQQQQSSENSQQTNAFNFQLPPSGFNFTPAAAHLISTPANVVGINQQQQGATTMLLNNVAPHVAFANFGAVSTNVVVAGATAKSTQTNFGIVEQQQTTTPITLADVYHPQVGAFQPTSAYSLTANFLNQTAVALAGGVGLQQQQQQQTQQQPAVVVAQQQQLVKPGVDLNTQTESNHDTALTLACAGGHEELVMLLLQRGADLEHQDKKGFTPLILAATAGHAGVVELLLDHGASPEAQSERTKDTALSLACSSGKKEVVEILLKRATNKEHRNVSDYTPLSLAASGGYTEIINLLLQYGAEINSRTGSKLGISPLMLAAMNGHVQAVKLLLEKGADINAQIETNRNTALTLACFQGRNEVVKLLLEYGANVEHRAKTGLTPLMEAASGGYVEVGRVLLHYGADPNCAPVPASRDTALTVAADKGHTKFVELLLQHGAQLDCKTKKGCTALWLACHGGYLEVVQALVKSNANVDAQDNRKVTPLMAAFRKGHLKVVKWLVRHVQQFPSDTECTRYLATILDKDTSVKCKQCMETIMAAKDRQAQEANKAAAVLLQELEHEQQLAETRRQAKQRQKEKKKAKRKAKKASQKGEDDDIDADKDQECNSDAILKEKTNIDEDEDDKNLGTEIASSKDNSPDATKDSAASSQPCSSRSSASGGSLERYQKHRRRTSSPIADHPMIGIDDSQPVMPVAEFIKVAELDERKRVPAFCSDKTDATDYDFQQALTRGGNNNNAECARRRRRPRRVRPTNYSKQDPGDVIKSMTVISTAHQHRYAVDGSKNLTKLRSNNNAVDSTKHVDYLSDADGWSKATTHKTLANVTQPANVVRSRGRSMGSNRVSATTARVDENTPVNTNGNNNAGNAANANNNATNISHFRNEAKRQSQRIYVSSQSIARVIGRGGNNINAIRESSGAHIEVEKQQKGQTDRLITIRGSSDSTKQAILMINGLINEPETPVQEIVSKVKRKDMKAMENFSHARGSTGYTMGSTDIVTVAAGATPLALKMYPGQTSEKTNGFPEMTFWSPSTVPVTKHNKSGVRDPSAIKSAIAISSTPTTTCSYTTATALSKATTVVSSSKLPKSDVTVISGAKPASAITPPTASQSMNMEYSPFSTPNVWFSRSSNVPQKMNFASVAAANIVTTSNAASTTTTVSTRNNPIPYPAAVVSYAAPPPPPPLPIQQQQPKQTADLSFDTDGRRSAGISSGYFSPISLPRPASATACVNVPLEQGTPPSPVSSTMFSLGNQQFHNIMLPTPIGGERRSRGPSTVPTALANVFGDYIDQQQNWDAGNRSNLDGNDWSSGFSGLSANLAQLQALQAMDVNASLMQNDYSAPYGANSCMSNETPLPNDNMMPSGNQMYDREFYQSAMWLAAYHQQQQQQQHLPTAPHQHQQQQQHRFVMPPPPSFSEPPPSAMSMYGNANFSVPADPWIGQQPTNANSWKYVNGNAATASSSGLLDYHATSATTNHVHSQHVVGHPPPPNLPMNHYRSTATQQSQQQQQQQRQLQQQQQLQQHGWSGWNSSLTMQ